APAEAHFPWEWVRLWHLYRRQGQFEFHGTDRFTPVKLHNPFLSNAGENYHGVIRAGTNHDGDTSHPAMLYPRSSERAGDGAIFRITTLATVNILFCDNNLHSSSALKC
ncbi:MAG TPA: hypothetical protein VLT36_02675, partial [Candidatus Dormibacteraeota bacterium]|nr:hypothetical protein [Candidatus Dormibacteraeota bacterium]